jgi:hypothetical protein
MAFWKRLLITLLAMLAGSVAASQIWWAALHTPMPSYLSGIIGGLIALPVWEFLKRINPKT